MLIHIESTSMLSTIATNRRPSAHPAIGRNRANRQFAYGLGIDDEVSYRIEDAASPEDVWTHRDNLGSLTSITDDAGLVVERYEYGDYGRVTIFDTNGDVLDSTQYYAVHLYTGRSLIAGTGLYDYRFRVMDPWSGRFNQRDPLWYIDSMNAYAYVVGNPMGLNDPFGLWSLKKWLLTGDGNASDEITDAAYDAFAQTVSDRVNGIGDAFGAESLSEKLGGTDHTFDEEERAKGECWANCVKDKLADALLDAVIDPYLGPAAPFVEVGIDDGSPTVDIGVPDLLDGIQGVSYGVGGSVTGAGRALDYGGRGAGYANRMRGNKWGVRTARRFRNSGQAIKKAGKRIKGPGHLATAIEAYLLMKECSDLCEECSDVY